MMNKEKFHNVLKIMNKNKSLIFLFLLFPMISIGGTIAYYNTTQSLENTFTTANYNTKMSEYFPITEWDEDNTLDKQLTISNEGSGGVLLRFTYNEMWYENGDVVNNLYNGKEIVTKNWTQAFINDFEYHEGWYYYKKVLNADESVTILDSVVRNYDVYDETSEYHLDFNYEVLQVENNASEYVWGYEAVIEGSNVTWR